MCLSSVESHRARTTLKCQCCSKTADPLKNQRNNCHPHSMNDLEKLLYELLTDLLPCLSCCFGSHQYLCTFQHAQMKLFVQSLYALHGQLTDVRTRCDRTRSSIDSISNAIEKLPSLLDYLHNEEILSNSVKFTKLPLWIQRVKILNNSLMQLKYCSEEKQVVRRIKIKQKIFL